MQTSLVSIIVPCYNMEKYLRRMLDSILLQTYRDIELILVNDGSTDGTRKIIAEYEHRLQDFCTKLKVVDQQNAGLAGAVNAGLKHVAGEFLTWPDADDWLEPNSIASRVEAMRRYPEVGLIRSNGYLFDEGSGTVTGTLMPVDGAEEVRDDVFQLLLYRNTFFAPVCHFARSSMFLDVNPTREIYITPRAPQNLQMLLPLTQVYPTLISPKPTGTYLQRPDSRSKVLGSRDPRRLYDRQAMMLDIIEHVIPTLRFQNPAGTRAVRQHCLRNVILPITIRGGMKTESKEVIAKCELGFLRKSLLRLLAWKRCLPIFKWVDRACAGYPTKVIARFTSLLARFPASQCVWDNRLNQPAR